MVEHDEKSPEFVIDPIRTGNGLQPARGDHSAIRGDDRSDGDPRFPTPINAHPFGHPDNGDRYSASAITHRYRHVHSS